MKKFAIYAAMAGVLASTVAPIPAQAAVKVYVAGVNGFNGNCDNLNVNDIIGNLLGNNSDGSDMLLPNLPGIGNPEIPEIPGIQPPVTPPQGGMDQGGTNQSAARQVLELVNAERAKAGLSPLNFSDSLSQAAMIRAKEITTKFDHTRPNGGSFSSVLDQSGISYRGAGENIAYGQPTAESVMSDWMNSAGHRANILNGNYTTLGVASYEVNGTVYWVQLFTY